ncbi:MAG: DUF3775 domain-containing protein [Phenylobacterium sp.]
MLDLDPELTLDPDTAFFILLKAREFDAKEAETDPDTGSNPSDDKAVDILEFRPGDAAEEELTSAIEALNEDQKLDLIALAWIGRGDFTFDEWAEARDSAREVGLALTARYILGLPTVSDYLEDALSQLGLSLDDYLGEEGRVSTGGPAG